MPDNTGTKRKKHDNDSERHLAPAATIKSREDQLIMLAYDLVEERIKKGTATSQEVTQFIKAGSTQAQLEKAKLEKENQLLDAKTKALESQKKSEEMYANALAAISKYQGRVDDD